MDSTDIPQSPSQRIIDAMGGIRPASRRVGKSPTTVQYWNERGIPQRHQQLVLDVCMRDGVLIDGRPVGPADFFGASDQSERAA